MPPLESWYVVKQPAGHCEIVQEIAQEMAQEMAQLDAASANQAAPASEETEGERWGPFASQGEAIARRVGLIRSGKCQPI